MRATPLLPRQLNTLTNEVQNGSENPVAVVVYETQGSSQVVKALTGHEVPTESTENGTAHFRLSNYLPTGGRLIERLKDAIAKSEWVFLYTGCSICPEAVLEFFEHIAEQEFDTPRIVIVGEHVDVNHGDERMKKLFSMVRLVNLTANPLW